MNPWIARNLIYRPVQAIRGEKIDEYMAAVRAFNSLPYSQMREIQWFRLVRLIEFAYNNNPYYRELYDKHGVDPRKISGFEDFAKLPFLLKSEIKEKHERMISAGKWRLSQRKTSGSTGTPLKFVKDIEALAYMNAVMHDVYSWHGIKIGDRQARIWAIPNEPRRKILIFFKDLLQNRTRLNSFDVSDDTSRKFYRKLLRFKPAFLYGVPSYILDFGRRLKRLGLNPAACGFKVIIVTGEILYKEQAEEIKELFESPLANEYGTTECGIIAFSCTKGNLHLMNHNLYVEIIDPRTGREVSEGETGEIVLTELHAFSMPFIRYRLGDRAVRRPGKCECGLELPMLAHVEGRLEDMITTPEGKKVAGGMLYYTLVKGIQQFKAYQRAIDRLEILIVRAPDFSDKILSDLYSQWRRYLGEKMKIEVKFVDSIPPDRSGKFRYFVPEIELDYVARSANQEKQNGTRP